MKHSLRALQASCLASVITVSLLACAGRSAQPTTGHADTGVRTDDQVAGVVNAANQGEVEQGQAALEKVQRDEVKEFAQQMIAMHSAAQQKAEGLLKTKNIQPAESPVSQQLASDSENLVRDIRDAATDRVDALYMDAQVNVHRRVLEIIDRELLPNVQDEELKADLLATRKTVEAHLAKAESIVNGL